MHCSLFQGTHIGGLWSEEIVFVETFAQSYKSISRVAGMSLTLEQRTKSIIISHTEENSEGDAMRVLIMYLRPFTPLWDPPPCLPLNSSGRDFLEHSSSKSGGFKQYNYYQNHSSEPYRSIFNDNELDLPWSHKTSVQETT